MAATAFRLSLVLGSPCVATTETTAFLRFVGVDGTEDAWRTEGMNLYSDSGCSVKLPVGTATTFYSTKLLSNGEEEYTCPCWGGTTGSCPCGDLQKDLGTCSYFGAATCQDGGICPGGRCALVLGLPASTTVRCVKFWQNTLGSSRRFMDTVRVEYSSNCNGARGPWTQLVEKAMPNQDFRQSTDIVLEGMPQPCAKPSTTTVTTTKPTTTKPITSTATKTTTTAVATTTKAKANNPTSTSPRIASGSECKVEKQCQSDLEESYQDTCKQEGQDCSSLLRGFLPARANMAAKGSLPSPLNVTRLCGTHRRNPECKCESSSIRVSSETEYSLGLSAGVEFPSGSVEAETNHAWDWQNGYETFLSKCECIRDEISINPRVVHASAQFLQRVAAAKGDEEAMKDVVINFGSHFVQSIKKGGRMIVETRARSCAQRQTNDIRLSAQGVTPKMDASGSVTASRVWAQEEQGEQISIHVNGGTATTDYTAWSESLADLKHTVSMGLGETRCLIPDDLKDEWDKAVQSILVPVSTPPPPKKEVPECRTDSGLPPKSHILSTFALVAISLFS